MKNPQKTMLRLVIILTMAGALGWLGIQQHRIITLRAEQAVLSQASQEADHLAEENKLAGKLVDRSTEVQQLRADNAGLLKLRSEVGQLHDRLKELAKPVTGMQIPPPR